MDQHAFLASAEQAPVAAKIGSRNVTLTKLFRRYGASPIALQRTFDGRELSRERYFRANEFLGSISLGFTTDLPDVLYTAGIVAQLGLSSHLLDIGFPDPWCAQHIGLNVDRSLAYANATGFGYACPETATLIAMLSPYWKWNRLHLVDRAALGDGGFTRDRVAALLAALLAHVSRVTGHVLHRAA